MREMGSLGGGPGRSGGAGAGRHPVTRFLEGWDEGRPPFLRRLWAKRQTDFLMLRFLNARPILYQGTVLPLRIQSVYTVYTVFLAYSRKKLYT